MANLTRKNQNSKFEFRTVHNRDGSERVVIFYRGEPVVTSEMLASSLGVTSKLIRQNFTNNKARYSSSKHFFLIDGTDLQDFKNCVENFDSVQLRKNARYIYLWTEAGAFNHVKSIGTDEAWDTYHSMLDTYFRQRDYLSMLSHVIPTETFMPHVKREVQIENSKNVNELNFRRGGLRACKDYNVESCRLHANGFTPSELKDWAKRRGMPSRHRTSGKEVLRHTKPELACAMSFTDSLCQKGVGLKHASQVSIDHAKAVFKFLLDNGITPPELNS